MFQKVERSSYRFGSTLLEQFLDPSQRRSINEPVLGGGLGGTPPSLQDPAASLDQYVHKGPFWSKKRRRFFQRAMSGIELAFTNKEEVRFLTLTSSPRSPEDIRRSWRTMVKRIRRKIGRFDYLAVKEFTKAGRSHIHALYRGKYLPQRWISDTWHQIHKANIVYIEKVYGDRRRVSNYLGKYLSKELSSKYWVSWDWIFRGSVGVWNQVLKIHVQKGLQNAVRVWTDFLQGKIDLFDRRIVNGRLVFLIQTRIHPCFDG